MTMLWIVVVLLSLLVLVCLLALVDQYRTMELIRAKLKLEDNPEPIPIPNDRPVNPSAIGLPNELDARAHVAVLFLSTSCTTCRSIAKGLQTKPSTDVWVVLMHAPNEEAGAAWLAAAQMPAERASVDVHGDIASALGIDVVPSVVVYREGDIVLAQSIPSFRQLVPLLSPTTLHKSLRVAPEGTVRI
jgi:hypothetical protein